MDAVCQSCPRTKSRGLGFDDADTKKAHNNNEGQRSEPCLEPRCGGVGEGEVMNEGIEEEGCDLRSERRTEEEREVGEKCQLAGHIRRQAQMRQPKADSLAHQLILNAQAIRCDRPNRRIHDNRLLACALPAL